MADFNFTLPKDAQLEQIKQQQLLAQLLMQQGMQQEDPYKTAGGLVVPQGPLSGLSKAAQQMAGAYIGKQAENKDRSLSDAFSQRLAGALSDPKIQSGVPAFKDPTSGQELVPAVAPGMDSLAAILKSGPSADNPYAKRYADALSLKSVENKGELESKVAYETDPRVLAAKQSIAAAGATRVNVGGQEKAEDKKVGEEFGQQYVDIQKAGIAAPGKIAKYDRLNQLLEGVPTGTFKGTTTDLKAAAKGAGINIEALGIKDDIAPIQAARALTSAMALELRNPSGGAGMPGAMSDKDLAFLQQMTPGIEMTPQGRAMMTDTAKKVAKRDVEVAQLARNYRQKNGRLDEGFYDALAKYSQENPLFTGSDMETPQIPANRPPLSTFMK